MVRTEKDAILISTGDKGVIKILRLIPAGSKELTASEFVNGYKIKVGEVLG
jgi:methionyl-tRNA formyltransferase